MRITIYLCLLAFAVAYAMWKGGAPERVGAAILLVMTIGLLALRPIFPASYGQIDGLAVAIDMVTAACLLALALKANRFWPLLACAAQLPTLTAHLARSTNPEIIGLAYGILIRVPSYFLCLILIVGTECHRRRTARSANLRSWRN